MRGPSKIRDVNMSPGPWSTSGLLFRVCNEQDSYRQTFLGYSGHMVQQVQQRFLHQKWLDIQSFTNFTDAHFAKKIFLNESFERFQSSRFVNTER